MGHMRCYNQDSKCERMIAVIAVILVFLMVQLLTREEIDETPAVPKSETTSTPDGWKIIKGRRAS